MNGHVPPALDPSFERDLAEVHARFEPECVLDQLSPSERVAFASARRALRAFTGGHPASLEVRMAFYEIEIVRSLERP